MFELNGLSAIGQKCRVQPFDNTSPALKLILTNHVQMCNFSCSSGVETVNRFGKLLQKEKNFKGLYEYYEKDPPKKAQISKRDEYHYHNTNGLHCDRHT